MLFERFEVEGLAHSSYAVGCERAKRVAIVDPERNVARYLDFARRHGLTITHVLETHIHADFASGARELGERTGAEVGVSAYDAGEAFEVSFPHGDLHDGDVIEVGAVRIRVVHTPGHTPEHVSFLVAEGSGPPLLMLTGDFLFVGALGRPDLLGAEATEGLARRLFTSVRETLRGLPGELRIHPAHGAGSMCGAGMGAAPSSTLAAERATNPFLDPRLDEESFVRRIIAVSPPRPAYYPKMKALNARGPATLARLPGLAPIDAARFATLVAGGATVIDLRDQGAFAAGHVPRAFCIGAGPQVAVWAGWVVDIDDRLLLVAQEEAAVVYAAHALVRIGADRIEGFLGGGMPAWEAAGQRVARHELIPAARLHERLAAGEAITILDVRNDGEWAAGHVDGAQHIFGGVLPERLDEIDRGAIVACTCGGGYRSAVAASVLERAGFPRVADVAGGMGAWRRAGLPLLSSDAAPVAASRASH
jgi:hydroxyacylglutathione hydrolase